MSDDLRRTLKSGLSGKRRKSLFRRIADSISSFVPSVIFPPSHNAENDAQATTRYSCGYSGREQLSANSTTQSRDCDTQTAAILDNCDVLNVDLDALDHSDGEMSAHSSTSGVSSLLPRNVVKSRSRTKANYPELHSDMGFSLSRISATCSDVTDSVASASTFRPSSVTPWIMSLKCKPAEALDSNRPLKKQRLSSNHSQCSSLSETDHQSLFYRSKTTYGGASSFRNGPHDVFATTMPLRFELEPAANTSTSESAILNGSNLSSTARRILESLERFSTPLAIADRVPLPVYPATSQRPVAFPLKKTFRSHRFPPYLHAYTHLKYLQNRKTGVGVNESVREVSKDDEQRPWSNPVLSVSSKATPETITNLPNPPGLCATTVGAIGFQNLPLLTASKVMHDTTPKSDFCLLETSKPSFSVHTASSSVSYTFASPIRRLPSVASQLALRSLQEPALKYTFSAPERPCRSLTSASPTSSAESFMYATKSKSESTFSKSVSSPILSLIMESTNKPDYSTSLQNAFTTKTPFSPSWRCETCLMENADVRDMCSACSLPRFKKASLATTLSVTTAVSDSTSVTTLSFAPSSSKWECSVCMVFNEPIVSECIACGAKCGKVDTVTDSVTTTSSCSAVQIASKIKNLWECPTCMVHNDAERSSCPCCGTSKPGAKPPFVQATSATDVWECPTCMITNANSKASCACCTTLKPTVEPSDVIGSSVNSGVSVTKTGTPFVNAFVSVTSSPTVFSFGWKPVTSASVDQSSRIELASVVQSSASKPPLVIPPAFGFGDPSLSAPKVATSEVVSLASSTCSQPMSKLTTGLSTPSSCSPVFSAIKPKDSPTNSVTFISCNPSVSSSATVAGLGKRSLAATDSSSNSGFQFGVPPTPKYSITSINGLVNGGPPNLFNVNASFASSQPAATFGFSTPSSLIASTTAISSTLPKFDFGCAQKSTFPSIQGSVPFLFGSKENSNSTAASFTTQLNPSSANQLASSPFVFGSSGANLPPVFTPASTVNSVFCFGANNPGGASATPQSGFFGQSNSQCTGNLFSTNSASVAPRKKAHAVRRFQR